MAPVKRPVPETASQDWLPAPAEAGWSPTSLLGYTAVVLSPFPEHLPMRLRALVFLAALAVSSACSPFVAPVVETDAGVPPVTGGEDAGEDLLDAGVVETDAGDPLADAGLITDAGSLDDAGHTPTDAGTPEPVVRFVAIGDTGTGGTGQYAVASAISQKCAQSGCDFVVMLGDNIYESGISSPDDVQMQDKFELPYASVNLPFYVVLGNHDYGGDGAGTDFGKGAHQIAYTQKSTKWKLPAAYYRFVKEHVEFFALDTNMQMFNLDAQQEQDVAQWLAQSTATWKILLGHHPYRSNGPHGNAGKYDGVEFVPIANGASVKSFADKIWCGKADFYFSGHDHSRQYLQSTCQGTELIVSGAGAKVTTLSGSNPYWWQEATIGLVWVEIRGRSMTIEFVNDAGVTQYTRTVTK